MSGHKIRTGLLPEHAGVAAPVHERLRLTIPAREALFRAGNTIEMPLGAGDPVFYRVELTGNVPPGLVLALIGEGERQHRGLRMADEPAYPEEWPESAIAWHERGDFVPCPSCGAPLVWYESGYVPGYRVCARAPHHHAQLAADGRSARAVRA